jgi:hypothetical protein
MPKILELQTEAQGTETVALPVCLCPWLENPYRLVSLLDIVNRIAANNLVHTGRLLQAMALSGAAEGISSCATFGQGDVAQFIKHIQQLKSDCDSLSLRVTSDLLAWVIADYTQATHTWGQVRSTIEFLAAAYEQELARGLFMHIDYDKAAYVRSVDEAIATPPFGMEARDAFQGSLWDIALAGNCYACAFNDACVFHLMRVLEKGLSALASEFSEPFLYENWHNVIERIEAKIRKMDSAYGADWKRKQQFYAEAATEFMFFKDAWRNHVMHGRDEYDAERAKNIYEHV